jgi:hypothetical protein
MRRPKLARLLDFEESRLPIVPRIRKVTDAIYGALLQILSRPDVFYCGNKKEAAFDVLAIAKGLVDAAGEREETDSHQLEKRVRRAVYGYLGFQ